MVKQENGKRAAFIRNISFNYAGKQVLCYVTLKNIPDILTAILLYAASKFIFLLSEPGILHFFSCFLLLTLCGPFIQLVSLLSNSEK